MNDETRRLYEAFRRLADAPDGARVTTPQREANRQAKINRARIRYEQSLCAEKGKPWYPR